MVNNGIDLLLKYFPDLTEKQKEQFAMLGDLYSDWNKKINVVSRKDVDELYVRHILHSLAIVKFFDFKPGNRIMDIGTGGGFPGIPLAIYFPESKFYMVDSTGKKIKVVNEVIQGTGLKNARAEQKRAEEVNAQFDYVVNRAVAPLETLWFWVGDKIKNNNGGLISLKGGDLKEEINALDAEVYEHNIKDIFDELFFETKKIVWVKA